MPIDHPYTTSAKDWVGGSRLWLTFSTVFADGGGWLGGSEKVQKCADVIYGWSPRELP